MSEARLVRTTFRTSRFLDFASKRELVAQAGHEVEDWALVALKELIDNAIDSAEEHEIAPVIDISVSTERNEIVVADNGPGIPTKTVKDVLDFSVRVSSREAYVSPTRGAQGNALKVVVAMPFALAEAQQNRTGETIIEARGVAHRIVFAVDPVRQIPRINYETAPSVVKKGTRVTVRWPRTASDLLKDAHRRFLQMAWAFGLFNPHLALALTWNNGRISGFHQPTRTGRNGAAATRHRPIGMTGNGSSAAWRLMLPMIWITSASGRRANSLPNSADFPVQ